MSFLVLDEPDAQASGHQEPLLRGWRGVPGAGGRLARRGLSYLPRGQSLSEDVWRVRHRTLSYLLWAHAVGIFFFALIRGYRVPDALMYASIVAAFALLAGTDPRRRKFVSAMNALRPAPSAQPGLVPRSGQSCSGPR